MATQENTVGSRIRALRHSQGMTQEDLAAACDVSRSAVAQWETDRAGQLRDNITRIADALATTIEYLLQGYIGLVIRRTGPFFCERPTSWPVVESLRRSQSPPQVYTVSSFTSLPVNSITSFSPRSGRRGCNVSQLRLLIVA
jgi:transcriptional regulator with XRE-family HTH domain